ncbi:MAG TPA: hypothetical protein VFC02_17355 [Anaerolineales bacterium]|nr:hypothetical protein [Anaerolineales bacterium]
MFFQEPTPDTSGYMIAGYAVVFIVMGLYVVSLYLRNRNLNRDVEMLEELDKAASELETNQPKLKKPTKTVTKRGRKKEQ